MAETKTGKGGKRTVRPQVSGPDIVISQTPMGRATLEDMQDEIRAAPWPRAPLVTVSYNDLPLDAASRRPAAKPERKGPPPLPRAAAPAAPEPPPPRPLMSSAPEIIIEETRAGRETLALMDDEELDDPRPSDGVARTEPLCDALELRTFVVPSDNLSPKATDAQKRAFLRERLAHRLPCSPAHVRRVDAKLLEPGAVVLRVWCPVD